MTDLSTAWWTAGGLAAAIAGWFAKRHLKRIDDLEESSKNLELMHVTKEDLDNVITKVNTHVTERTTELKVSVDAAHKRIDKWYEIQLKKAE